MELKDWLNSINFNKENLIKESSHIVKEYPPFIINKCLSGHLDCVLFANEMNKYHFLDKDMQYNFYLNILRKRKRFSPWVRKEKVSDLEFVKSYYGYNNEKASQALKILSKEQLDYIKQKLDTGGKR
tara:strand:+ start:650 stop:1030 length:381 start_codon:yes stop_codon:yes gene_type:complete